MRKRERERGDDSLKVATEPSFIRIRKYHRASCKSCRSSADQKRGCSDTFLISIRSYSLVLAACRAARSRDRSRTGAARHIFRFALRCAYRNRARDANKFQTRGKLARRRSFTRRSAALRGASAMRKTLASPLPTLPPPRARPRRGAART